VIVRKPEETLPSWFKLLGLLSIDQSGRDFMAQPKMNEQVKVTFFLLAVSTSFVTFLWRSSKTRFGSATRSSFARRSRQTRSVFSWPKISTRTFPATSATYLRYVLLVRVLNLFFFPPRSTSTLTARSSLGQASKNSSTRSNPSRVRTRRPRRTRPTLLRPRSASSLTLSASLHPSPRGLARGDASEN